MRGAFVSPKPKASPCCRVRCMSASPIPLPAPVPHRGVHGHNHPSAMPVAARSAVSGPLPWCLTNSPWLFPLFAFVFAGLDHLYPFSVAQTHTFLHIITQSCLTLSRIEDGTHGPTVEACSGSPMQTWLLRNYTRLEVFRKIFRSPTDYFL